jgi:diketogulonate reductase-like aldo/keto reductase
LLLEIAQKYDKTPYQVALNWLISQPNVVVIPKTSDIEHLDENLGALGWELAAEDVERLRKDFPTQRTVSDVFSLNHEGDIEP